MTICQFILKTFRFSYRKIFGTNQSASFHRISDPQTASDLIYQHLMSDKPCMVARFGSTELMTMINYLGVHNTGKKSILKYIQGKEPDWWWNENCLSQMCQWSGFFPPTIEKVEQFCEMMINDIPLVDILGSWLDNENYFRTELKNATLVEVLLLEPYWAKNPWTKALEGKKVLVVHPFAQSIEMQYRKRKLLFENADVLPEFELRIVKAIQSLGGDNNGFADWFAALNRMKEMIDSADYDVCLLGCGAYGFPLAAYIKRAGKKAVHLGGCLQLLFGIRGARWENPDYNPTYNYVQMMNEHWIKPSTDEKSKNANQVENACYW